MLFAIILKLKCALALIEFKKKVQFYYLGLYKYRHWKYSCRLLLWMARKDNGLGLELAKLDQKQQYVT